MPRAPAPAPATFKYGMPLYGIVWPEGHLFYICGGGGSSSSGIKNRLVIAEARDGTLSDQVGEHMFGLDCPTRMAMAPSGKSLVFAMSKGGIKRLDLDVKGKVPKVAEVSGTLQERLATIQLEVTAMAFNTGGDLLALGAEDGSLVVYEWPGLKPKMELSGDKKLKGGIKDLDFMPGTRSRLLAAVLDNGSCEVWDTDKSSALCSVGLSRGQMRSDTIMTVQSGVRLVVQHMPKGMDGVQFSRARYSRDGSSKLYALMNNRSGAHLGCWSQSADGVLSLQSKLKVTDQPGACMEISLDGSKIAVGTSEGSVMVVSLAPKLAVIKRTPKCHMIFSTAITFSSDGNWVLSTSADASATLTDTTPDKTDWKRIIGLIVILLAILVNILVQGMKVMRVYGISTSRLRAALGMRKDEL